MAKTLIRLVLLFLLLSQQALLAHAYEHAIEQGDDHFCLVCSHQSDNSHAILESFFPPQPYINGNQQILVGHNNPLFPCYSSPNNRSPPVIS